jgi:GT2 family glycosyltransferase
MTLSVIIVNYNVKFFLEQCLHSALKAMQHISGEIIVIDNNSSDGSIRYLQPLFPSVRFIANKENIGFGKACNQGLKLSKGAFILFLNPDTIVPEDCFEKCIGFLQSHPQAGALGIKMLDGAGKFLPESKRAFPSPLTSFYKLTGLSSLFPHSRIFSRYHLGYLDENSNHEIDVLAGAFMMMPKKVLDEVGAFDEVFFMYGEDVDLSYRIQKAGYRNYYFAETSLIHFKGESTRKGSLNYVKLFYKAMSIFVKKHYGGSKAGVFNFFIQLAIWLRAGVSALGNLLRWIGLPVIDALLILFSFWLMKLFWYGYVRTDIRYDESLLAIAFPSFTFIFWIAAYYAGLYDGSFRHAKLLKASITAGLVTLAAYSILPETVRFSRAIVLLAPLLAYILMALLRQLLVSSGRIETDDEEEEKRQTLIVGAATEYDRVLKLLKDAGRHERVLGRVAVTENENSVVGYWKNLPQLLGSVPVKEIIFCEGTLSYADIINSLPLHISSIRIKFFAAAGNSIIGSDSKNTSGEFIARQQQFNIQHPVKKRGKRLLDMLLAIFLLITYPLQLFIIKNPLGLLRNIIEVMAAKKTWVGYTIHEQSLPVLRRSVIGCNGLRLTDNKLPEESLQRVDFWYASDYEIWKDIELIIKGWRLLGA